MEHAGKHRPLAKMLDWDISVFTFDNTTIFILFSSNSFQNVLFPVTSAFREHRVPWTAPAAPAVPAGAALGKYQNGRRFPAISAFGLGQHWIVTSKYATALVILRLVINRNACSGQQTEMLNTSGPLQLLPLIIQVSSTH